MEGKPDELSSVGVAVRVRPLNNSEKAGSSEVCVTVDQKERLIIMGKERSFVFDQVFGIDSKQEDIFLNCTKDLVLSVFSGYNATVLAYGQTGSGKTYTMGSGQITNMKEEDIGIIPRVISMIFDEVEKRKQRAEFIIKVSFLEIYNEEIHDLLEANSMVPEKPISIREDKGSIFLMGLHEEKVTNCEEMFTCLERGTLQRIVASTLMNASSSRSHAIFTINIEQQVIEVQPEVTEGQEYMIAKFHFVDLAGSERAKRTGAVGATLREGISINKGLLCLGNVISALTEDSQKKAHVPYRDSKLTRILQDSLGGNAKTYMIACISPAEINFEETLNTLKYASRARNIKNKPVINRDPQSAMISALKQEVSTLKAEIKTYQKLLSQNPNEDIRACVESMKRQCPDNDVEDVKIANMKTQQLEKKLTANSQELETSKKILSDCQLELLETKKERDLLKIKNEKYIGLLKANNIERDDDDEVSKQLIEEYNDRIDKLKITNESKDKLIMELQSLKDNLEKALERERRLLDKRNDEFEKFKRSCNAPSMDISQMLLKNVDDYGRIFAETIMATINKQEGLDEEQEGEVEEEVSVTENVEIKEQKEISEVEEAGVKGQEELADVEVKIKEKEEIMKSIEETFRELQSKLIEEMSKQYYKKVEELELEKRSTERERDIALDKIKNGSSSDKQEVAEKFKSKIQALEEKLKENKHKDREITAMQKLVESQRVQLAKLDEEIRKAKTDRIRLQKRIKEEAEEIQKWKMTKQKEILAMKRNGLKKDQEIQFLKSENRKKEIIAKKKAEEVVMMQRRQKEAVLRKKNPVSVNLETLKQWVQEYTTACIDEREISMLMTEEIAIKDDCEKEILELTSILSQKSLKLERLELILSDNEPGVDQNELYCSTTSLKEEIQEILDRIEILEDKIKHETELVLGYSRALSNSRVEDIKSRSLTISSLEESQSLVSVLFDEILAKASQIKQLNKTTQAKDAEIESKENMILQGQNEIELVIKKYENELNKVKTDFRVKECSLIEELNMLRSPDPEYELSSRKSLNDLKAPVGGKMSKVEEEKARPRNSTFVTLNKAREDMKKKKAADEGDKIRKSPIGRHGTKTEEESPNKMPLTKARTSSENDPGRTTQKWKLMNNVNAQKGPIYSMITQENILYTAFNQTIKVWSLDSFTTISEFPLHTSAIKSMALSPQNNLIFSSCGNIIKLTDTVSLNTVATLQAQMEEVRTLKISNTFLYTAGKNTESGFSINIWDLRKSQAPYCELEKSQDIFSLNVTNNAFYYGRKSFNVCKTMIGSEEIQVYEPAHGNIITSIGKYGDNLVTAGRDSCIKQWDPLGNCLSSIGNSHTDWINCLEVDHMNRHLYSGGKEGKIKVWRGTENLKMVGELLGLNSSVLCISSIISNDCMLASAGNDKSFKVWKMIEDNCNM